MCHYFCQVIHAHKKPTARNLNYVYGSHYANTNFQGQFFYSLVNWSKFGEGFLSRTHGKTHVKVEAQLEALQASFRTAILVLYPSPLSKVGWLSENVSTDKKAFSLQVIIWSDFALFPCYAISLESWHVVIKSCRKERSPVLCTIFVCELTLSFFPLPFFSSLLQSELLGKPKKGKMEEKVFEFWRHF